MQKDYEVILEITAVEFLKDRDVISQIPETFREKLGELEGSGMNLHTGARDLFFEKGSLSYVSGTEECKITFYEQLSLDIKPLEVLEDSKLLDQIPSLLKERLGEMYEESDHSTDGTWELGFKNGLIKYEVGEDTCSVIFDRVEA